MYEQDRTPPTNGKTTVLETHLMTQNPNPGVSPHKRIAPLLTLPWHIP